MAFTRRGQTSTLITEKCQVIMTLGVILEQCGFEDEERPRNSTESSNWPNSKSVDGVK